MIKIPSCCSIARQFKPISLNPPNGMTRIALCSKASATLSV